MGKSSINGPLSMAILDNQRVPNIIDKKTCLKPPILRIPMISLAKTEWVMAGEEAHDCQEKKGLGSD